jgi:hypothetical protein
MKKFILSLSILTILIFFDSCKKDKVAPVSASYNYFPTQQGKFVVYTVDSIVHRTDDNSNDDSVSYYHFEIKDVIDSSFYDLSGKKRQVILRYYKDSMNDWTLRNVWSQLLTSSAAYRYEDNVAYHKLAFPINSSIKWDGNDMNTEDEELYEYEELHSANTFNGLQFDSTITVLQRDDLYFIGSIYGKEIYAAGIGMIFHQRDELNFNGVGQVSSGTEYKMTVIDYGQQ